LDSKHLPRARRGLAWLRYAGAATLVTWQLSQVSAAQAEPNAAEARTLAREFALQGADAYERHDDAAALDRFRRAYALYAAPSISVMEARCLVRLGRLLEALDKYEETAHANLTPDAPEAFRGAVLDAQREVAELRARIPRLEVRVSGDARQLEQMKLELDGKPVPAALLNVERPIDPGPHRLTGRQPNGVPIKVLFTLAETDRRLVEVVMDTSQLKPIAEEQSAPTAARRPLTQRRDFWGYSSLGLGAVAVGVGAVSGLTALHRKEQLDEVCNPGCPLNAAKDLDSFRTQRTVSYAAFALGAAALGVGSYLLLTPKTEKTQISWGLGWKQIKLSGSF